MLMDSAKHSAYCFVIILYDDYQIEDIRIFFSFNYAIILICGLFSQDKLKVKKLKDKRIAIVSDHAGYFLKEKLFSYLIRGKI